MKKFGSWKQAKFETEMIPAIREAGLDIEKLPIAEQQNISANILALLESNSNSYNKHDFTTVAFFYLAKKFKDRIVNLTDGHTALALAGTNYAIKHHPYLCEFTLNYIDQGDVDHKVTNEKPAQLANDLEVSAEEKFRLLIDYNKFARQGWEKISELPDTFKNQYRDAILKEKSSSHNFKAIAEGLLKKYNSALRPYLSNELNDALEEARSISSDAEKEFMKAISVADGQLKAKDLLEKIEARYGKSKRSKNSQKEEVLARQNKDLFKDEKRKSLNKLKDQSNQDLATITKVFVFLTTNVFGLLLLTAFLFLYLYLL